MDIQETVASQILSDLASFEHRPLDFVYWAYPWGEAGTELAKRSGPEKWQFNLLFAIQEKFAESEAAGLATLAEALQIAVRSGHGIGKTALLSWLITWAICTKEDTRGRATANTEKQLRTILWAELAKWHRLFIAKDFFTHTATAYHAKDPEREKNWRVDAIPWSEENSQAFAGLHNFGKRVFVLFDEASTISDSIWEVIDGVMHEAETELIWVCTGNPTRNTGRFRDCFTGGRFESEWLTFKVDSREVSFANKDKINRAIALWGEDSDYVKKRYLGEFPSASSSQLIPVDVIERAMRTQPISYHYEPLIIAVDVARYGDNESVIVFRRGRDARTVPAQRFRGLSTTELGSKVAALILQHNPDAVFIDEGGVGGGVVDFVRHLGHHVIGVNFGSSPSSQPDGIRCANKRAEMYLLTKLWLSSGGAIENSIELKDQLVAIEYYYQKKTEALLLVSKEDMEEDGVPSPDWADALAISFAYPVHKKAWAISRGTVKVEYDPLAHSALPNQDGPSSGPYEGALDDYAR